MSESMGFMKVSFHDVSRGLSLGFLSLRKGRR
jgi:hypothetical protein